MSLNLEDFKQEHTFEDTFEKVQMFRMYHKIFCIWSKNRKDKFLEQEHINFVASEFDKMGILRVIMRISNLYLELNEDELKWIPDDIKKMWDWSKKNKSLI